MSSRTSRAWDLADRTAFLAQTPLFGRLSHAALEQIAACFRVKRVSRSGFVFLEGAPATNLNVLAEGQDVILRLIQPGEVFGGAGGWGESSYPASARAQDNVVVLQLGADEFSRLIADQPVFTQAVMHELGQRLRVAEARIRDLQTQRVERRLARALLRLANKTGVKTSAGIDLGSPLSRQDLAELAGTTLSTASRTLSAWDQQGIVSSGRERITILRPHELVSMAEDLPPTDADTGKHRIRPDLSQRKDKPPERAAFFAAPSRWTSQATASRPRPRLTTS